MMATRVVLSLFISLVMIGATIFARLSTNDDAGGIIAIPNPEPRSETKKEIFLSENQRNTESEGPVMLKAEDVIARQMLSELSELSASGRATSENLNVIANAYVNGIASQKIVSKKIANIQDLSVMTDTPENIFQYGKEMISLRSKYADSVRKISSGVEPNNVTGFNRFIAASGDLYLASANELLRIRVPATLAENHLAIINNYFQSAEALKIIADSPDDPLSMYSAIQTQVQNSKKEGELFLNIQIAMSSNNNVFQQGM